MSEESAGVQHQAKINTYRNGGERQQRRRKKKKSGQRRREQQTRNGSNGENHQRKQKSININGKRNGVSVAGGQ